MGSYAVPLLGPAASGLSAGPDVYATECSHVFEGETEPTCSMAVLVSLSDNPEDRIALWPLREALMFAQTTEIGGLDWPARLSKYVAALRPTFVTAVIHVGSDGDMVAESVQSTVDMLRSQIGAALALVVVVSATTESLMKIVDVTGFVRGVHSTGGETARHVYLALASLICNSSLNCIDMEDLLPVFGSAEAPTILAEAVWLRADGGRLVYLSDADRGAVVQSGHTVSIPYLGDPSLREVRNFFRAIRNDVPESANSIFFATSNALMPGLHSASIGLVPILCAPAGKHP